MSDIIHLATRKGLFTVKRNSEGQWKIAHDAFLGDNCSMVLHDHRNGALYAALDHGHFGVKLHRSNDDGHTWQEITVPEYPPPPDGYTPKKHPAFGTPIEWKLNLIWALETGGDDKPGRLWCGTLPGGLFRSDDEGQTWELNRTLWDDDRREEWFGGGYPQPGIHSICVDPRNSDHISIGVSCGGVWRTRDGGETWKQHEAGMRAEYMPPETAFEPNSQDPHRLVQCKASPDVMWVQHHNGIFSSHDAGMNWTEHSENARPSSFGFAVVVHPKNPEIAWFVPGIKDEKRIPEGGRFLVTRTTDGGKSFEQLANGLPREHAYDLVFRHGLDINETGDRLVMGSTTGSAWISEDGGDSWQTISANLPPIYAARFACKHT